ncbi:MAG TPA: ABC transporter substrate-binding protein [Thermoanaerobaculia bacterium]|nr:ABC transporter substrate-binding protein [Thermoanaerobaculia bacterium]
MKRTIFITALILPLALALGCGGRESGAGGGRGNPQQDLVIAFASSPTNLDARIGNDNASGRIFDLIYSGLVAVTKQNTYAPDLAERWETPDDRTLIFHLRPNLKFHDGRPLTAQDVKWTYDSLMAEDFASGKKSGYAAVASIEAPDDRTVIFRLSEPNGGILANLNLGIVPRGADAEVYKTRPIGAGPYRVTEFTTDERVVMESFDDWHLGTPNIKRVIARIVPDATTRVLELRRGSINFEINNIPFDQVAGFENNPEFKVLKEPGATYQYLAFNMRDPILAKKPVRQAIAHAIDRDRIINDLLLGYGTKTESIFPPGHWARAEGLPSYDFDPARAKQLLDQAGHPDPDGDGPRSRFTLSFKTSTDPEANQRAQIIQQMLKNVGIDMQIQSNEFGTFYEDIQKGNFQMFSLSRGGIPDPDFYQVIFHSASVPPEGQNRGYYINPRMDQLIEQGRSTFDQARRKQFYDEAQRILADDIPYISLYHQTNIAVMRDYLDAFEMYPSGFLLSVPNMTSSAE